LFDAEDAMIKPVMGWMQSEGLIVKREFVTPSGICDLVGLSFRKSSVRRRRQLGQLQPIGSMTRAALLLRIPDPDAGASKWISPRRLLSDFASIPEEHVEMHLQQLVNDGFVRRPTPNRLEKRDGWVPVHERLIAIELKLSRVEEALCQARNNLIFADESYVALPEDLAVRVAANIARWRSLAERTVGLIAVSRRRCNLIIRPRQSSVVDPVVQFHCAEKFWRTESRRC
jgi:hypothetical protein